MINADRKPSRIFCLHENTHSENMGPPLSHLTRTAPSFPINISLLTP